MSNGYTVVVAGATGLVGKTMVKVLEERDFPVGRLVLSLRMCYAGTLF